MTQLDDLKAKARSTRRKLDQQEGVRRKIASDGKRVKGEVADLKKEIFHYEKAAIVLNNIAKTRQETAEQQIEALVTQGLRTIFDEEISFHVVTSIKNNSTYKEFVIKSDYDGRVVETPVLDSRGGGTAAIVGFLLRVVILLLSSDKQESILFLDEVFAFVSKEYGEKLAKFVRWLVDNTHLVVVAIMHTHVDEFLEIADKRYKFELDRVGSTKAIDI